MRRRFAASLRLEGMLLFAPDSLEFDPNFQYTYCRICGAVFQTRADRRLDQELEDILDNMEIRRNWSFQHSKTHSSREHALLQLSGLYVTAEAAHRLDAYGIKFVGAAVIDDETKHALAEAPRLPSDDAEGS